MRPWGWAFAGTSQDGPEHYYDLGGLVLAVVLTCAWYCLVVFGCGVVVAGQPIIGVPIVVLGVVELLRMT